jgi:YD repeat-containing protein
MALKTCSVEGVNSSKVITKYRYHNAMYHKYGHGFMGFAMTIAETYHNSTDSLWTTRKVRWNESSTMGKYAMLLPQQDFSYVNNGDEIIATNKTRYTFTNVQLAGLSKLVVCPAMTGKTEEIYSVDEDDELIATVTTSYQYNYNSNHTYDNVYGCTNMTETVTGHGNRNTTTELQTVKLTELQTIPSSWIVNRPLNETVTRTRNNESTATKTCYTYASNNSYRLDTVRVIPNDGSQPNDPLTLFTLYDYDALGHIIGITTTAPYGIHGEQPRKTGYEYNADYQHRLVSREIKGDINDGYITTYAYDFHDRPSSVTDCNGKRTVSVSSILGTDQSVSLPDGTEQRSLTMWTGYSPSKPENACYYTWSKKTGGVTSMTFYHN